jgi:hypothetical protein
MRRMGAGGVGYPAGRPTLSDPAARPTVSDPAGRQIVVGVRVRGSIVRALVLAFSLGLATTGAPATAASLSAGPPLTAAAAPLTTSDAGHVAAAGLAPWTGGIDLYRSGTYSMQRTWTWCTAASVQIIRNIVRRAADHSATAQRRYFTYMRAHDRYRIPASDGVDPQGWVAGLRHFVDDRYRIVSSSSYDAAIRSAVVRLRLTNRPVGVIVARGAHAWVLTGFTATADPAATSAFTITSVRVTGPLYGRQSRNGYDMRPDTKLTYAAFRRFFTPFHYGRIRMAWEGRYVTIQAVPTR